MSLRHHWSSLQPREQRTLLAGGGALLAALVWAFLIHPFNLELKRLEQSVAAQRATLSWMEQAAAEARQLRATRPAAVEARPQSLLTLVDGAARAQGLGDAVKRVQPEGESVRVWLEQAPFDTLLRWIDQLGGKQAVRVTALSVEPTKLPGRVDARVVLAGRKP